MCQYHATLYRAGLASDAAFDARAEDLYEEAARLRQAYRQAGEPPLKDDLCALCSTPTSPPT